MRKKIRAILTAILTGIAVTHILEGRCPNCGSVFYGWALLMPRHRTCNKCGSGLDIFQDGEKVVPGYSPFTAEKYQVDQSAKDQSSVSKDQESRDSDSSQKNKE